MALRDNDPRGIGGYALLDRLGSGGMGTVFLARAESGWPVALKIVHEQFAADAEFRTRFRQEVRAARRVSGAFTAPVVDADPDAARPWMATAYVPGRALRDRVESEGPLSGAELRVLAVGLVEALRELHQVRVVHRDLKPDNVLLTEDGPRVIDFGISRAPDRQTLTVTGRILMQWVGASPAFLDLPNAHIAALTVSERGFYGLLATPADGHRFVELDVPGNGGTLWKAPLEFTCDTVAPAPIVTGQRAYVICGDRGAVIDLTRHKAVSRFELPSPMSQWGEVNTSAIVAGGIVFAPTMTGWASVDPYATPV
ncbi:serine/threonine-protein kinase [Streptomyces sp. NPDC008122]|uniref:serine/threonine-protein kinase n=1 Tax=Streptomyces sp. NPDC008122 TaxID=3364810 RepID=UPI0036E1C101